MAKKIYVLLGDVIRHEPRLYLYGIYNDKNILRDAIIKVATPIRDSLQFVPQYNECLVKANLNWDVTTAACLQNVPFSECLIGAENTTECHLNEIEKMKCIYYESLNEYYAYLEEALENLHNPQDNIYVIETSMNALPLKFKYFDDCFINGKKYQLFPPFHYPSISELYDGEEVFNLFEGQFSNMEPEIRKMINSRRI